MPRAKPAAAPQIPAAQAAAKPRPTMVLATASAGGAAFRQQTPNRGDRTRWPTRQMLRLAARTSTRSGRRSLSPARERRRLPWNGRRVSATPPRRS